MNFGIPKEVRPYEFRVGMTPAAVDALVRAGHQVFVEHDAGAAAGFHDEVYRKVGAQIVYSHHEAYGRADVVVKVARPTSEEYSDFRKGQTIISFLNLAVASPDLLEALQEKKITAIGMETIEKDDGTLPVLLPTSEVAGRMAPVIAGQLLQNIHGGRGILLSGIPGIPPAAVVILGAGILGTNAARAFYNLGAEVTILDKNIQALQRIDTLFQGKVATMLANPFNVAKALSFADVVIGAVAVPGGRAPVLITREHLKTMRKRSVFIDFSIDSGGSAETSRPTTLKSPYFTEENVIHYCVPNVPAMVARTASYAIANSLLPYLLLISEKDVEKAIKEERSLARGVNVFKGKLAHPNVARALGKKPEVEL